MAGYQGDGDDEIEMQALQTRVLVPERSMVRAGRFGVPQTGAGYNVTPQLTAVTILPGGDVPARADVQVSLFSILLENLQCGVVGITRCLETCFPVREPEDRTGVGAAVAEFVIDMQPHARYVLFLVFIHLIANLNVYTALIRIASRNIPTLSRRAVSIP